MILHPVICTVCGNKDLSLPYVVRVRALVSASKITHSRVTVLHRHSEVQKKKWIRRRQRWTMGQGGTEDGNKRKNEV
jgi:hypothetical protein